PTEPSVRAFAPPTHPCTELTISVTHSDSASGCVTTRTFTISASDACGNSVSAPNAVYTWTTDTTAPTITASPSGSNLGCNPAAASLPSDASVKALVTATDACSAATISGTHGGGARGCGTRRP